MEHELATLYSYVSIFKEKPILLLSEKIIDPC